MTIWATDKLNTNADAYALLARAAREEWGFPILPEQFRTQSGKPYFPLLPDCHFNLSHSGNFALCALDNAPVGVDIQIIKDTWREGLPRRVCSEQELFWLSTQRNPLRAFTLLWALKEAKVKYTGAGLRVGVREISVPLPKPDQTLYRHDFLWFRVYRGEGWMGAVCGENEAPEHLIWV